MPEWASTLVIVFVVLLILFGMWQGWRVRARRDAGLTPPRVAPAGLGEPTVAVRVFYAATTVHGKPLERLMMRGLGFRAHGDLAVHPCGLLLRLDGTEDVWVAASALISVQPAQTVIDKAVEKDGLLALSWRVPGSTRAAGSDGGETTVDSYFRVLEPEKSRALYDAMESIASAESEV